ncbi:MAG: hypothetical protein JNM27_00280 [Leptospirales bacterium]|nr:hypothetical protein [Leptospirales bacterium]
MSLVRNLRRGSAFFIVLMTIAMLAQCSKDKHGDSQFLLFSAPQASAGQIPGFDPANPASSVSQHVSAASGGTLYLNNEVTLTIPPGSLSEDTTIEIKKLAQIPDADRQGFTAFSQAYELLPEGTTFDPSKPARLSVRYDNAKMAADLLDPAQGQIMYLNEQMNAYVGVPNSVDTDTAVINAEITHFTIYMPVAKSFAAISSGPTVMILDTMPVSAQVVVGAPVYVRAQVTHPQAATGGSVASVQLTYTIKGQTPKTVIMQPEKVPDPNYTPTTASNDIYGFVIPSGEWGSNPCGVVGVGNEIDLQVVAYDNGGKVAGPVNYAVNTTRVLTPGSSSLQTTGTSNVITAGYTRTYRVRANYRNSCAGGQVAATLPADPSTVSVPASPGDVDVAVYPGYSTIAVTPKRTLKDTNQLTDPTKAYTLNVAFAPADLPFASFKVMPGSIVSMEILDTNGNSISGPITVPGRSTYQLDARGVDVFGNQVAIYPSWSVDPSIGTVAADGTVSIQNNATLAGISASFGILSAPPIQMNVIPRYTVTANVTGLVGSTTLELNGVTEPAAITSNGSYVLQGFVADFTTPTVMAAVQPFMGACHADNTQFVGSADIVVNVKCFQLQGNSIVGSAPTAIGFSSFAGSGAAGSTDAFGSFASFNNPYSMTTDGKYLYVTETSGNRIRRINATDGKVDTVAGGASGYLDGIGAAARFSSPVGITTDGTALYVAESGNCDVRRIDLRTKNVTTLAGSAGSCSALDGTGTAARFSTPQGVVTDGTHVYVADAGAHAIRKVHIASRIVSAVAGLYGTAGNADSNVSTSVRFNTPHLITADATHLYVGDYYNYSVRKVPKTMSGPSTITLAILSPGESPGGMTFIGGELFLTAHDSGFTRDVIRMDPVTGSFTTIFNWGTHGFGITSPDGSRLFFTSYAGHSINVTN